MQDIVKSMQDRLAEINERLPEDWEALVIERDQISDALAALQPSPAVASVVLQDRPRTAEDRPEVAQSANGLSDEDIVRAVAAADMDSVPTRVIREATGIQDPRLLTQHLNAMLGQGLLTKRGERRATTYRLTAKGRKLATAA